jgi:putative acetyltransferase
MTASVRSEEARDQGAVHTINCAAFGRAEEAKLVDLLRERAEPLVSLVAEEVGAVVGHILFTPVSLVGYRKLLMGLAPMAVGPARQRAGIGSALVRAGLERCKLLDAAAVVVLGHPAYYPRFGFVPAAAFGLACEYDVPAEAFMALELRPGALRGAAGTLRYHAAFAEVDA